ILLVFLLCTCGLLGLCAEDIKTNDGRVFKNAIVVKLESEGIVIKHDGGSKQIGWAQLPADLRKRDQAEAQKQKAAEIQKLKQDLARAEAEAAKLKQEEEISSKSESKRPTGGPEKSSASKASTPDGNPPKAARRAVDSPELKSDTIVEAVELVRQFTTDSAAAEAWCRQRRFRVQGVVQRFEAKLFHRQFDVVLESPEKFMRVILQFDYPDDYKSVYTTENGQKLVARLAG